MNIFMSTYTAGYEKMYVNGALVINNLKIDDLLGDECFFYVNLRSWLQENVCKQCSFECDMGKYSTRPIH